MLFYANELNINLRQGIYTWTLGPSYETPAEIVDIYNKGGNAVGMSTVPEILVANHCGIKSIAISIVTNYAAGLSKNKLSHKETLSEAKKSEKNIINLIKFFIKDYK